MEEEEEEGESDASKPKRFLGLSLGIASPPSPSPRRFSSPAGRAAIDAGGGGGGELPRDTPPLGQMARTAWRPRRQRGRCQGSRLSSPPPLPAPGRAPVRCSARRVAWGKRSATALAPSAAPECSPLQPINICFLLTPLEFSHLNYIKWSSRSGEGRARRAAAAASPALRLLISLAAPLSIHPDSAFASPEESGDRRGAGAGVGVRGGGRRGDLESFSFLWLKMSHS